MKLREIFLNSRGLSLGDYGYTRDPGEIELPWGDRICSTLSSLV
ncbi:hypothetical protein ABE137_23675 [Brevibacillus laterosporus]